MNYVSFIIKILEKPIQTVFNKEISVTRFLAEFSKINDEKFKPIIKIAIWANHSDNISTDFFVGNYIIIEGYISFRNKQIEISVFKVYPFLF